MKYLSVIIFSLSFLFMSCDAPKKMSKEPTYQSESFDTEAHRGGRGLMPENTIPAMVRGLGMGVKTLELDVVISKDGKVLLSHEPFFNHAITTLPNGDFIAEAEEKNYNIYQMNYAEVLKYDVGLKPHPRFPQQQKMAAVKPLLADVFKAVHNYMLTAKRPDVFFNIETKTQPFTDNIYHPAPAVFVEALMKVIKEAGVSERVIIQSFDFRTLQYLHKNYPQIKTAMLIEADDARNFDEQLNDLGFIPTIYSPAYELVNPALITACHNKNIKIIPWTVNTKEEIARKLNLSGKTVATHKSRLMIKLGVNDTMSMARLAAQHGITEPAKAL